MRITYYLSVREGDVRGREIARYYIDTGIVRRLDEHGSIYPQEGDDYHYRYGAEFKLSLARLIAAEMEFPLLERPGVIYWLDHDGGD